MKVERTGGAVQMPNLYCIRPASHSGNSHGSPERDRKQDIGHSHGHYVRHGIVKQGQVAIRFSHISGMLLHLQILGLWAELQVTMDKPWFFHPLKEGERIFVYADVPHLVKLGRNHLIGMLL